MILSTVRLAISAEHKPEVLRTLRVFMGHTTARAGCVGFWLSQDLTNPEALTISDLWTTRADLDAHVRSDEYRLLLAVIDLSVTLRHQLRRSPSHRWSRRRRRCESRAHDSEG
jgi:quinol monooxygenase YgiN